MKADHDRRKWRIAEKGRQVIAAEGLEAATIRRIAEELGCSTRAITHYFGDKDELLMWIYEGLAAEGESIFVEVLKRDPTDLIGCLLGMTAVDAQSIALWRVYVAFWERAGRDPRFAEAQRRSIAQARALVAGATGHARGTSGDREREALELLALVNGISVQVLLDPQSWSAEQARITLEAAIARLAD